MILETIEDLIDVLGTEYDGKGIWLNIGGSQGVSGGETYIELDTVETLNDLANSFIEFTECWCADYADDYTDYAALADAREEDDWDAMEEIRDEGLAECIADCGDRYVTGLVNSFTPIKIKFDGSIFEV